MACNPTRIELSNAATTTVQITLATDPGDGTTVTLEVDELGIDASTTTTSAVATFSITAVSAANNSIWDATIQVGANRPATAEVLVVETNTNQTVGVTIDDSSVTYCAPSGGGGGTGDALTSGDLDQFADVTYPTAFRDSDILSRSSDTSWQVQRPEYLRVDRRPICGSWYAAQEFDAGWGVTNVAYRRTPVTGADMSDPATNGKLKFIEDRFLVNTIGANGKMRYGFERYSIGNPAGMHLNNAAGFYHYPAIAGSGLTLTESTLRSADNSTVVETLQTPFTDDGTTGGTVGDNIEAWQYAIGYLRDQFVFNDNLDNSKRRPIEVSCYVGYKPQYTDAAQTQYERTALGVNPDFARSGFPGFWDDGFWSFEWAILESVGFDTLGFDTGGRMWFDSGTEGRAVIDGCIDTINDKFFVEAIARQSGGLQEEDTRCYENVRSLTIFPQLASIVYNGEEYTKIAGDGSDFNNGSVRVSQWKLDPSNTECHVLFNWFDIKEDARFNQEIVEGCAREAHRRGFVVGVYNVLGNATIPATDGGDYTAADLCKFVEDLYLESVDELRLDNLHDVEAPAPTDGDVLTWNGTSGFWEPSAVSGTGAVESVNGETGAVVLTGDEIDTTATSGVTITDQITIVSGIAVQNSFDIDNLVLNDLDDVNATTPSDGEVLTWDNATSNWVPSAVSGTGTVTSVGLSVPGGFTVAGTNPITSSGTFEITSTLDGVIVGDGAATFSGGGVINDLADVNIAMGAGNQDDVLYYDHAAGAGSKIKGSPIADLLPAVEDSYLMLIETPSDKTYTLDGRVAAARTVTNFYAKTSSGTCTATLKNLTAIPPATIGTISVTSTGGSAASLTNTSLTATDRIAIEIISSSSPADLEMVVEYTQ